MASNIITTKHKKQNKEKTRKNHFEMNTEKFIINDYIKIFTGNNYSSKDLVCVDILFVLPSKYSISHDELMKYIELHKKDFLHIAKEKLNNYLQKRLNRYQATYTISDFYIKSMLLNTKSREICIVFKNKDWRGKELFEE